MAKEVIVFDSQDVEKNKTIAILMSIFTILFFLPLVDDSMKNSAYLKHTANSTLLVILLSVATSIVAPIIGFIPFIGGFISVIVGLAASVFYIINIVYTVQANGKSLPLLESFEIIK